MFCMKMTGTMMDSLKKAADRDNRTVHSLLQTIIADYLTKEGFPIHRKDLHERRRFPRKKVDLPSVARTTSGTSMITAPGVVLDISMGGILISYPRDSKIKVAINGGLPSFDLDLQIPSTQQEVSFACKARRVSAADRNIIIGAAFQKPDEYNLETLKEYLM